jgi:hypothetical protein
VPDHSVSGDNFDLVGGDPHDPATTSETRSANAISEPTPDGYRPCWCKISLITKINSCAQSNNEQESEASNLNITRRWSSESQGQHVFVRVLVYLNLDVKQNSSCKRYKTLTNKGGAAPRVVDVGVQP